MSKDKRDLDAELDRVLASIRDEEADDALVDAATERAWERISAAQNERDASGSVTQFRKPQERAESRSRGGRMWFGLAAAVVLLAAIGLGSLLLPPAPMEGTVGEATRIEGVLFKIADLQSEPLSAGDEIQTETVYRTGFGGGASVTLDDGSVVELDERSSFRVRRRGEETTIDVAQGRMIVEAAPQGEGHLHVRAPDCQVTVVGTVFAVNSGLKGSRVSVIEGEVEVRAEKTGLAVLNPGDQVTTSENLTAVPLEEEIAWSDKLDQHLALMRELIAVQEEVAARVGTPKLRHDTTLLNLSPANTVFFASIPNFAPTLATAHDVIRERAQENPVLGRFWNEEIVAQGVDEELDEIMKAVRRWGDALGDEIVVALPMEGNSPGAPLLMAGVKDADELRSLLEESRASVDGLYAYGPELLASPGADATAEGLHVLVLDELIMAAPEFVRVKSAYARLRGDEARLFQGSAFHAALAKRYAGGAEWLFGADLELIVGGLEREESGEEGAKVLAFLGVDDARHVILEKRSEGERSRHDVVMTFGGQRHGMMSWLAEPAPMRSLEFVSADASALMTMAIKEPSALFDEDLAGFLSSDALEGLAKMEAETGVNLRDDLMAALGGEFTVAIDGTLLPMPAWKVVVEAYDPARLQHALEGLITRASDLAAEQQVTPPSLESSEVRGRTFHELKGGSFPLSLHYTFADGYMLLAPSRVLLDQAIATREARASILSNPAFLAKLPSDGNTNFSAIFYQDLSRVLGPWAESLANQGQLSEEQSQMVSEILGSGAASLSWVYAESDSIRLSGSRQGGLLDLTSGAFLRGASLLGILGEADIQDAEESEVQMEDSGAQDA